MNNNDADYKEILLDIVGSSIYGRDPKIMSSRTFNMLEADGWFVDYGGYKNILTLSPNGAGRGIFNSFKANKLICVAYNAVYAISVYGSTTGGGKLYNVQKVGTIGSFYGDVFIDENDNQQIAICDQFNLYIYDYGHDVFKVAPLPTGVIPGYVTYQNGYFIVPDTSSDFWYLSALNDGFNWHWGASGEPVNGAIETKADYAQVVIRFPGKGNLILAMGNTVTEPWTNVPTSAQLPYQKSSTINFDYGCLNPATVAVSDNMVAWLAYNEKSGPVIMYTTGAETQQLSTDGINYKISKLNHPEKSCAFFIKLSGHLVYQLTFYDPSDNYSLIYDFTTQKFFDVTDENQNYHIARRAAFFDNDYYFVSLNDGNLYQMSASFTEYDYGTFSDGSPKVYDIPKIRVTKNIRMPNSERFAINRATFILEQGTDPYNLAESTNYSPRIAASISKNGGFSFSSYVSKPIYTTGNFVNRLNWWQLGFSNDFVMQFRFYGKGAFRCTDGVLGIYR